MESILTYLERNNDSFEKSAFNCIDALVLSWLSYFCYPESIKNGKSAALRDLKNSGLLPDSEMYAVAFNTKKSKKLFKLFSESKRFADAEFSDFIDDNDEVKEKHFAALCIKIAQNKYFLAFRGTDPTFTGWKEDFNLACHYPIPSQSCAKDYLCEEMRKHPNGEFYLGGHSKGGNIAVYAAIMAEKAYQKRIINVFNFDGPGFINDICTEEGFKNVDGKILKYIPGASLFGMLFESGNKYFIIKSRSISVMQHDPFSWEVKNNNFKYVKYRSKSSVKLERAINDWVTELSLDERGRMVDIIYNALYTLDTRDFNVVLKTFYRQIPALYRQYKGLEPDDKIFFDEKIKRLKFLLYGKRGKTE